VPDIVSLIIWLIAGATGGMATSELLMGEYDLGPLSLVTGAIGGVVSAQILQILIPALGGFEIGPMFGQIIAAVVGATVLTVVTGGVNRWRQSHR
jgi:uncharacterized membrane protein YeaQ/YmgE (transglycosylase-associated protein family)